jgi:hypothetical protein
MAVSADCFKGRKSLQELTRLLAEQGDEEDWNVRFSSGNLIVSATTGNLYPDEATA